MKIFQSWQQPLSLTKSKQRCPKSRVLGVYERYDWSDGFTQSNYDWVSGTESGHTTDIIGWSLLVEKSQKIVFFLSRGVLTEKWPGLSTLVYIRLSIITCMWWLYNLHRGSSKLSLMRRSLRKRKAVVKYECDTKVRHRDTGRRIVKKSATGDNPLKRKHIHGNVISERQVRNEVRKSLSPLIESILQSKRKTNSAQKTISKLKKNSTIAMKNSSTQQIVSMT